MLQSLIYSVYLIQYVSMQLTISFTLQTYFLDDLDDAEAAELPTKHAKLMPLTFDYL